MRRPLVLLTAALLGCGGHEATKVGDDDDDDDDTTEPECAADEECAPLVEICDAGACVAGDRDDGLADASPLFQGEEQAVRGVLATPGDLDTYAYESPGDEWVSVRTVVPEGSEVDTVVEVLRSNGALHAVVDDFPVWPFRASGYDSVMYVYLPDPGTWYVTVQDASTYYDLEPASGEGFAYDVLIRGAGGTSEPDGADDPSATLALPDGSTILSIGVLLEERGDVDHVVLDQPTDALLEVWGQVGIEGSDAVAEVRLFDEDGDRVATKTDLGPSGWLSWFETQPGSFRLEATDADGGGGPDHWFPIYARTYEADDVHPFFGDNAYGAEAPEPNDDQAVAVTADPEEDDAGGYDAFRVQGRVDAEADLDRFQLGQGQGREVSVRCWTDRFGSEADLTATLLADGAAFATGGAPDEDDYYVVGAAAPAGDLELRVEADPGSAVGPAGWYRCSAYLR